MHKRLLLTLACVLALSLSSLAAHKSKKVMASGAPDKAYLQKLMDGWSAGTPANMAQYYDKGDYTFFDITPLKYNNWAEYQKGVEEVLKNYKSFKLTVNDDAPDPHRWQSHLVSRHGKGRCGDDCWQARVGHVALDRHLRKTGWQVDDRARAHIRAVADKNGRLSIGQVSFPAPCHPGAQRRTRALRGESELVPSEQKLAAPANAQVLRCAQDDSHFKTAADEKPPR